MSKHTTDQVSTVTVLPVKGRPDIIIITIKFPNGEHWTLQYRSYKGRAAFVDIMLDAMHQIGAYGAGMEPAKKISSARKTGHLRTADHIRVAL